MKRKASEILLFMQGIVIFFLIGFLIFINNMEQALPYVWTRVIVIVLVLIIIGLLCIYNYVYKKEQRVKQEQVRLQEVLMVREENQACHAVIHDTRHFLYTVQSLLEHEDIEEAKKLLQDCVDAKLTKKRFCNRAVLNVILQYYQSVCDKAGPPPAPAPRRAAPPPPPDILGAVLSDLNDTEMTVLFGNLLENAYEAAGNQGFIELRVDVNEHSGMTVIEEKKSYLGEIKKDKAGKLITSKNKEEHGIGMQSIEKIVRRHEGVYIYDFDKNTHIFRSKIALPDRKC